MKSIKFEGKHGIGGFGIIDLTFSHSPLNVISFFAKHGSVNNKISPMLHNLFLAIINSLKMNNAKVEGYVFLAKESVEIGMDKCFFFILFLWLKFSWLYEF